MPVLVTNQAHSAATDLAVTNPVTATLTVTSPGRVLVAVVWETTATTVSGVTVNGNAATYVTNSESANIANKVRWYYITGVSAGSRTVSVTMSGTGGCAISAFDVPGWNGTGITANLTATASTTAAVSVTGISVTAGQLLLAANSLGEDGRTNTWTNATEASDVNAHTMGATSAYYAVTSTNASYSVTCTASSSTSRHALSVILLDPSPGIASLTPSSPYPGQSVTAVIDGFTSAPNTANSSYGGVGQTLGTATTTLVTFTWPARSTFIFGGSHAAHDYNTDYTLTLGNGTESASLTVQTSPEQAGGYGTKDSGASPLDLGTWNAGAITLATGDHVRLHVTSGTALLNPATPQYTPTSSSVTIEGSYYDVSAGSWSGLTTITWTDAAESGVVYSVLTSVIRPIIIEAVN